MKKANSSTFFVHFKGLEEDLPHCVCLELNARQFADFQETLPHFTIAVIFIKSVPDKINSLKFANRMLKVCKSICTKAMDTPYFNTNKLSLVSTGVR